MHPALGKRPAIGAEHRLGGKARRPGERVALPGLGAGLELDVDALYAGTELLEGQAAGS
jgi:hypothetical protein